MGDNKAACQSSQGPSLFQGPHALHGSQAQTARVRIHCCSLLRSMRVCQLLGSLLCTAGMCLY